MLLLPCWRSGPGARQPTSRSAARACRCSQNDSVLSRRLSACHRAGGHHRLCCCCAVADSHVPLASPLTNSPLRFLLWLPCQRAVRWRRPHAPKLMCLQELRTGLLDSIQSAAAGDHRPRRPTSARLHRHPSRETVTSIDEEAWLGPSAVDGAVGVVWRREEPLQPAGELRRHSNL